MSRSAYTGLGIAAILLWSSTFALSRRLGEQLGMMTAAACIYLSAGVLGCAYLVLARRLGAVRRLPRPYLLGSGGLFVLYTVCIYAAIGLAATRAQVIGVGIINYLWPPLTLVLSVPLLGRRAGPLLLPGAVVAAVGAAVAGLVSARLDPAAMLRGSSGAAVPYLLAAVAAVSWALYSNLCRRWGRGAETGAVPLFLLGSGLALGLLRAVFPEEAHWSPAALAQLAYMAVFVALLAYAFWDAAMRRGNAVLVAAISYATPLLSTAVSSLYLGVRPGAVIWAAGAMVVAGAVTCKLSVRETPEEVSL